MLPGENQTSHDEIEGRLNLLYEETGRVTAVFWEWRHKVILLCSAVLTLAFAGSSWMYKERLGGIAIALPLLLAGLVAAACRSFDRRNGEIIHDCLSAGEECERRLRDLDLDIPLPHGVYGRILERRDNYSPYHPPKGTYSRTLRRGYALISLLLLSGAAAAIAIAAVSPSVLIPGHS